MVDTNLSSLIFERGSLSLGELKQVVTRLRSPDGAPFDASSRAMMWRLFLGLLPLPLTSTSTTTGKGGMGDASDEENVLTGWNTVLHKLTVEYYEMKKNTMPSADKVQADPLAALFDAPLEADGSKADDEWTAYEKTLELGKFIGGDLDRLYLSGIEDEYFHRADRKKILLDILLLWSTRNKHISYRQGMHEIIAPMLYALELELATLESLRSSDSASPSSFRDCISQKSLEAHGYYMFESIMKQLNVLYDPAPKKRGCENQPEIVHFVTNLQDKHLNKLDPVLCTTLIDNNVYAQVYGMRWTRLLFGREFPMTHTMSFRNWDYILSAAFHNDGSSSRGSGGDASIFSACRIFAHPEKKPKRWGEYGPIIDVVGDFALGMMLNVRQDIIEGDQLAALGLLMHYPVVEDVTPILVLTEEVGTGAYLRRHMPGGGIAEEDGSFMSVNAGASAGSGKGSSSSAKKNPSWLAAKAIESQALLDVHASRNDSASSVPPSAPFPTTVESMDKEEISRNLPCPPSAPLPVRVLQRAGSGMASVSSGLASVGSGILDSGRAMGGGIRNAASFVGGAITGASGGVKSNATVIDPVDPFKQKKSNALDAFNDNDDDSSSNFTPVKKISSRTTIEDDEPLISSKSKGSAAASSMTVTTATISHPSWEIAESTTEGEQEDAKKSLCVSPSVSNADIGCKIQEIADALVSAPSGSAAIRKSSAAKLLMLVALLEIEGEGGSLDAYNVKYPQSAYAKAATGAAKAAIIEANSRGSPIQSLSTGSSRDNPSPGSKEKTKSVSFDLVQKPLTFDLAADQAAKKVARQKTLASLLDME